MSGRHPADDIQQRGPAGLGQVRPGEAPEVAAHQQEAGADVLVVGSANLDVVLVVDALPGAGETVLAGRRERGAGGKGANQAVAAARCGARTWFAGAVGDDDDGRLLREGLAGAGVGLDLLRTSASPTGTAYVVVDADGENAIVVDPGANAVLELDDEQRAAAAAARVVLCQLEVPIPAVHAAMAAAGGLRVLNAAPARPLPDALADLLDVLVVNESEALAVAGASTVDEAVARLVERVPEVVVTRGARGALLGRRGRPAVRVPGLPARAVVDTTGAGDAFCGAWAAARAAGAGALEAARTGCAAGSLAVEQAGAASAAPTLAEVRARLGEAGP